MAPAKRRNNMLFRAPVNVRTILYHYITRLLYNSARRARVYKRH